MFVKYSNYFKLVKVYSFPISIHLFILVYLRHLPCHQRRSGVFIVNFEQISHIVLVFPLLTLNK